MTLPLYLQITVGVIVGVGSYFIGNINTAVALSKLKGKDIRKCGSGNPGTMNMIRTFGKPFGALTLLLDVAKGVLPSLLGWLFMGNGEFLRLGADRLGLYVGGLCAEIGHIYPVAMKFKGGKGVATLLGVCLTCKPVIWVASMAVGIAFLFVAKIGSLTSFIMRLHTWRRITGSSPSTGSSRIRYLGRQDMASQKAACFCIPLLMRRIRAFSGRENTDLNFS